MRYDFKLLPELYWAVGTAIAFVLFTELAGLHPEGVPDWKVWAVTLGGAIFRAVGGAGLNWLRVLMQSSNTSTSIPASTKDLYAVMHDDCGRVAFLTSERPRIGEKIDLDEVFALSGKPFDADTAFVCAACGKPVVGSDVLNGIWVTHTEASSRPPSISTTGAE